MAEVWGQTCASFVVVVDMTAPAKRRKQAMEREIPECFPVLAGLE